MNYSMFTGYDVAQVCVDGHMVNGSSKSLPQFNKSRCGKCGAETIRECPDCGASIKGHYYTPGVHSLVEDQADSFCHNCGKAYPWTERKREAALEFFIETLEVPEDQQDQLKKDLTDISSDNPRTQLASFRIGKWLAKAGKETAGMLRDIVVDIVSETAKKIIWPNE